MHFDALRLVALRMEEKIGETPQHRTGEKFSYAHLRTCTQPIQLFTAGGKLAVHSQPVLQAGLMGPAWRPAFCIWGAILDLTWVLGWSAFLSIQQPRTLQALQVRERSTQWTPQPTKKLCAFKLWLLFVRKPRAEDRGLLRSTQHLGCVRKVQLGGGSSRFARCFHGNLALRSPIISRTRGHGHIVERWRMYCNVARRPAFC